MFTEWRAYIISSSSAGLVTDLCPAEFVKDRVIEPRGLVSRPVSAPKRQLVFLSVNGSVRQSVSLSAGPPVQKQLLTHLLANQPLTHWIAQLLIY